MKREQELAIKALANVLHAKMGKKQQQQNFETINIDADPLSQAIHSAINTSLNAIVRSSLNEEVVRALAKLGPVEVKCDVGPIANELDLKPLIDVIEDIVGRVASKPTEVQIDTQALAEMVSEFSKSMRAYERTMEQHNRLMEKLIESLGKAKQPEIVVNVPEPKKRVKVIHRDADGNISSVEEK